VKVTVMMMGEMSLDDWDEKSGTKNDQDEVDGMLNVKIGFYIVPILGRKFIRKARMKHIAMKGR